MYLIKVCVLKRILHLVYRSHMNSFCTCNGDSGITRESTRHHSYAVQKPVSDDIHLIKLVIALFLHKSKSNFRKIQKGNMSVFRQSWLKKMHILHEIAYFFTFEYQQNLKALAPLVLIAFACSNPTKQDYFPQFPFLSALTAKNVPAPLSLQAYLYQARHQVSFRNLKQRYLIQLHCPKIFALYL